MSAMMMMMFGYVTTVSFQIGDMAEVPIEALVKENGDGVLEGIQGVSIIWDHIHDKAAKNIKWV